MLIDLNKKIDKLNQNIEKSNLLEIAYLIGNKRQIFARNFFAGLARGVGIGIGITIITAILIYILQRIILLNIPVIGDYITDIVQIVERNNGKV